MLMQPQPGPMAPLPRPPHGAMAPPLPLGPPPAPAYPNGGLSHPRTCSLTDGSAAPAMAPAAQPPLPPLPPPPLPAAAGILQPRLPNMSSDALPRFVEAAPQPPLPPAAPAPVSLSALAPSMAPPLPMALPTGGSPTSGSAPPSSLGSRPASVESDARPGSRRPSIDQATGHGGGLEALVGLAPRGEPLDEAALAALTPDSMDELAAWAMKCHIATSPPPAHGPTPWQDTAAAPAAAPRLNIDPVRVNAETGRVEAVDSPVEPGISNRQVSFQTQMVRRAVSFIFNDEQEAVIAA